MFLYNLTLQKGRSINRAVVGNFSAPKAHEIVVARNKTLELLRPDEHGKTVTVFSTEVFGIIRSLAAFRLTGSRLPRGRERFRPRRDRAAQSRRRKVHQETFGKSGVRRIVPGQHLVVDPKGRALMIGALEKTKLVYVVGSSAAARSPSRVRSRRTSRTSSPSRSPRSTAGWRTPGSRPSSWITPTRTRRGGGGCCGWAQTHLTFYELDLGLNHVARRSSEPIDNGANLLIPIGGNGRPRRRARVRGELRDVQERERTGRGAARGDPAAERALRRPRRAHRVGAAHRDKRDGFFVLAQSVRRRVQSHAGERVWEVRRRRGARVANVRLVYFDTVPPCADMCVLKTGFLFAASELGDHALYQFASLGDDAATPIGESSSRSLVETDQGYQPVFFDPTPLRHLVAIDRLESLCPTLDLQCHELLGEETPQLYALCGAGSRSTLKTLKRGVALTEMAVSPLPGNPNGLFTVRESSSASSGREGSLDAFIVVSFVDATLVLRVGETVEEVGDSGFLGDVPTLSASRLGDDALLQIHPGGCGTCGGRARERVAVPRAQDGYEMRGERAPGARRAQRRRGRVLRARPDGRADGNGEDRDQRRRRVPECAERA